MSKTKKVKTTKKQVKAKTTSKRTSKKFKLEKPMIIVGLIILALIILSYVLMGLEISIILTIGILLILALARLLDKVKNKPKQKRVLNIILIIFFILAIIVCLLVGAFVTMIVVKAPAFDITELNKQEKSILYDSDGELMAELGKELRENITYDDLPEVFVDALIATEDSRFFQHNGFDAPRFIKASIGQLLGNSKAGGASTLSMQLIKNTYTSFESDGIDGIIRKFTDIYLAVFKLEKNFSKKEIIEYYVNNLELGHNAWGVEQASQTYFGKSVKELNLSEAALLVGMFNAPTAYDPFTNPDSATARRSTVLNLMVTHGYITREEANAAKAIPVSSLITKSSSTAAYQAYIDTVVEELKEVHKINPFTTAVLVYTNMDAKRQASLDDIFNGNSTFKWANDTVNSGVAVVEVSTGKLVAVGAGRNKTDSYTLNYATQIKRQIGSTAKPIFDYGPAIEYLNYSTYQQIVDEPWSYSTGQAINNSDNKFMGQISMRTALAQSRNIPALKTFQEVQSKAGNDKILEFATNLGMTPQVENGKLFEAHSLGAFDGTSPLQMASAYAAFANGGTYIEPLTVNKVVFRSDNTVQTFEGEKTKAMSESTAFMITDMLVTAVESGLSSGAKISGVTLAAKTGTTNYDGATKKAYNLPYNAINDAWVVGYDTEYAVSMWYGYETAKDGYNTVTTAAVQRGRLYRAIGNVIFNKNTGKTFQAPSSVVKVCVENGSSNPILLASDYTPEDQITCEYFKKGSEPQETSSKYSKLDTVSNLKVSYDENTQKVTISWSRLNAPAGYESFGDFGYNVYYGDILLGFTTENSYTLEANSNISGTYKVVTTYQNYNGNQSDPATYEFQTGSSTSTAVYGLSLIGTSPVTISPTDSYQDLDIPVQLLRNGISINDQVNIKSLLKTTIKDPSGTTITSISGSNTNQLATGTYTITYSITYEGKTYTKTRQVIVN